MTTDTAHLLDQARAWIADDPDEVTRAELESVVAAAESGDAAALDDLADRFRGLLAFGTAGLRGAFWDPARLPEDARLTVHALPTEDGQTVSGPDTFVPPERRRIDLGFTLRERESA